MAITHIDIRNYELSEDDDMEIDHEDHQSIVPLAYHPAVGKDEAFYGLRRPKASLTFAIITRQE